MYYVIMEANNIIQIIEQTKNYYKDKHDILDKYQDQYNGVYDKDYISYHKESGRSAYFVKKTMSVINRKVGNST